MITLFGNLIILSFSYFFYFLEADINPALNSFLDAIWWGFATATTVGYGDIIPLTPMGKLTGILLMLVGTALFATYTAIFAQTILEDEFFRLNKHTSLDNNIDLEKEILLKDLKKHRDFLNKQIKHHESS